jgi:hypothetical protein
VLVSVRFLFEAGKRLSDYAIKTQRPRQGCLVIEKGLGETLRARLVDEDGRDRLDWLDGAHVAASGPRGMLITGVQYAKKGVKHSAQNRQAWWCQAPPATAPIIDHAERVRAAEAAFDARAKEERF